MAEIPAPHRLAKQITVFALFRVVDLLRAFRSRVQLEWQQPGDRDG